MDRTLAVSMTLILLAGCGGSSNFAQPADAAALAAALTGDAQGPPADNALCRLFTPPELAIYAGEALQAPQNAAMGTGCQWTAQDGEGNVLLQVVPKRYHRNTSMAEGYRKLRDLAIDGNIAPDMGGWFAAAIVGEESFIVGVVSDGASAAQTEDLLRETIRRRSAAPP